MPGHSLYDPVRDMRARYNACELHIRQMERRFAQQENERAWKTLMDVSEQSLPAERTDKLWWWPTWAFSVFRSTNRWPRLRLGRLGLRFR